MTRAIVIGAGMGGLTAALALSARGMEVEVFERASELREAGAGLTLSSGALRALDGVGLLDEVRRVSGVSARIPFMHYRTGQLLWGEAAGEEAEPEGQPFVSRHVFRADLQRVLADAWQARRPGKLHLGHALSTFKQDKRGVSATFANGHTAQGDVLIGADGLHSVVRAALWGASAPAFTGQVAWRFLVPRALAVPHLGAGRAAVYLGPDRVFNRYTMRGGELLNCVGIVRTPGWQGEGWSTLGDPLELAALFDGWHADVRALMALAPRDHLVKWALGVRPALPSWNAGRVAVLGDAAHPMLPFLGLGAAMALEDAVVLARAFALEASPDAALARYDAARRPRATAVADASVHQGIALQTQDPDHFKGGDAPAANRAFFDHDPMTAAI